MSTKPRKTNRRPAAPPAKPNISALAREHGVSRESLRLWKLEGTNLSNPAEIAARVARMKTARPARKKPAKPEVNISALSRQLGVSRESLRQWRIEGVDLSKPEQLAERVARMHTGPAGSEPMKRERLRKLKADASLAEHELARRRGSVITADAVESLFNGLTLACIAQFKRGPAELPGLLEGMDCPAMKEALMNFRDEQIDSVRAQVEGVFSQLEKSHPHQ